MITTPLDEPDADAPPEPCFTFVVALPARQAEQFELLLEQTKRLGNVQTNAAALALMTEWYLIPDHAEDQAVH